MTLTPELLLGLINFSVKFGLDAALVIMRSLQSLATIDDAIKAWELAASKSAQDYLDEAKQKQTGSIS
jgi:hypothetical protein